MHTNLPLSGSCPLAVLTCVVIQSIRTRVPRADRAGRGSRQSGTNILDKEVQPSRLFAVRRMSGNPCFQE